MKKAGKECPISYGGNQYFVPAEYKQIVLHKLCYHKSTMKVDKAHYKNLTVKQTFDIGNTLFVNPEIVDFNTLSINLEVYDCE